MKGLIKIEKEEFEMIGTYNSSCLLLHTLQAYNS